MTATTLSDAEMSTLSRSLRVDASDSIEGLVQFLLLFPLTIVVRCYQKVVPKVRVELTPGHPHRLFVNCEAWTTCVPGGRKAQNRSRYGIDPFLSRENASQIRVVCPPDYSHPILGDGAESPILARILMIKPAGTPPSVSDKSPIRTLITLKTMLTSKSVGRYMRQSDLVISVSNCEISE